MVYEYEVPFIDPNQKPHDKPNSTETKKPKRQKRKKRKSRKESLRLENLVDADFRLHHRNFEKEFPINSNGEYTSYDIGTIVDRISYESRELKRLIREQAGQTTLDMFAPPPKPEERALVLEAEEHGIYTVARTEALRKLGFYGEPWKWSIVFSVISEETWRRRKMRTEWKQRKTIREAQEAADNHHLPLDN